MEKTSLCISDHSLFAGGGGIKILFGTGISIFVICLFDYHLQRKEKRENLVGNEEGIFS